MVTRPNDRALRGRNDIVSSPGAIDASSGGIAIGTALANIGDRTMRRVMQRAGDQLTRDVIATERQRGREAGLEGTTRLADGTVIPAVALREDNSIASQAFNEGLLQVAPNRFQTEILRTLDRIEQETRGRPDTYMAETSAWYEAFRGSLPAELQSDFDPMFQRSIAAGRRRQESIFVGRQRQNVRTSNIEGIEELFATAGREAFNLVTVNPEQREIAGQIVIDTRSRLEAMLSQTDVLGDAIYSAAERESILRSFDEQTLISQALGGFERAPDKEGYVRSWVDVQRQAGEETPTTIDKVESRLFTELRRHNTGISEARTDLRRETAGALDVLEAGFTPAGLLDLQRRLTDAGMVDELEGLRLGVEFRETMLDYSQSSLADQQRLLREAMDPAEPMTPEQLALGQAMSRQHANALSNLVGPSASPYVHAQRTGIIETVAPIDDFSADALALRGMQQDRIANTFGVQVPFLRAGEAQAIIAQFNSGDPATAVSVMSSLSTLPPDKLDGVVTQLSGDNAAVARAIQFAGLPAGQQNANLIVQGYQLGLLPEASDLKPTGEQMRTAIEAVFGDIGGTDPNVFSSFSATTEAIALALARQAGDTRPDDTQLKNAALIAGGGVMFDGDVVGGPFAFAGNHILPPAPGVTEGEFTDMVRALTPDDLTRYSVDGSSPSFSDGRAFTPDMIQAGVGGIANLGGFFTSGAFVFESRGQGIYAIRDRAGRFVQSRAGAYLINLGAAWTDGIGRVERPETVPRVPVQEQGNVRPPTESLRQPTTTPFDPGQFFSSRPR